MFFAGGALMLVQVSLVLLLILLSIEGKPPPGYQKPLEEIDKDPPKYEYGYSIADEKGTGQGKLESRDGEHAQGRYFVQGASSNQNVEYIADDWGFHPLVEYSNVEPHSRVRTELAIGEEAVNALRQSKQMQFNPEQGNTESSQLLKQPTDPDGENSVVASTTVSPVPIAPTTEISDTSAQTLGPNFENKDEGLPQTTEIPMQDKISSSDGVFVQQLPFEGVIQRFLDDQNSIQQNVGSEDQQSEPPSKSNIFIIERPQLVSFHNPMDLAGLVESHIHQIQNDQRKESAKNTGRNDDFDEGILRQQVAGSFGSKLSAPGHATGRPLHTQEIRPRTRKPSRLVENTSKLISGQDVLNINDAIGKAAEDTAVASATPSLLKVTEQNFASTDVSLSQINVVELDRVQSTTPASITSTVQPMQLSKQPIIVEEYEDGQVTSEINQVTENVQGSTVENIISEDSQAIQSETDSSSVLVTPRPVSANFLAPITAGIRLQHIEQNQPEMPKRTQTKEKYLVEIQKTLPYYIGKLEYMENEADDISLQPDGNSTNKEAEKTAVAHLELGAALMNFPVPSIPNGRPEFVQQLPLEHRKQVFADTQDYQQLNDINVQQLPSTSINTKFAEYDQQQAQGEQIQVPIQQGAAAIVEKVKPVPQPLVQVDVTKAIPQYITAPNQLHIPIQVPYSVDKNVPITVTLEKVIEKPVPVQVDKIIEKPVRVPYEVTKYVDRPYPVQFTVPQPYPVEVRVPIPFPVHVPQPAPANKKVPVPQFIEKPSHVERPFVQYIDKPHPLPAKAPLSVQPYYIQVPFIQRANTAATYTLPYPNYVSVYFQQHFPSNPKTPQAQQLRAPHYKPQQLLPVNDQKPVDTKQTLYQYSYSPPNGLRGYLPPPGSPKPAYDQESAQSFLQGQFAFGGNSYGGLLPPKAQSYRSGGQQTRNQQHFGRLRSARSNLKNPRLEYGFLPPMIPSLQIDENGNPIEKDEQR